MDTPSINLSTNNDFILQRR